MILVLVQLLPPELHHWYWYRFNLKWRYTPQGSSSVARLREIEFDTQIVGPDGIFNNLKATTLNPKTNSTLTINCTNTTITDTLTITA